MSGSDFIMNNESFSKIVHVGTLYALSEEEIREIFFQTNPIYQGHFQLVSKWHSDMFLRFAVITHYPWLVEKISQELATWATKTLKGPVSVVLSTSRSGMMLAYQVASLLRKQSKCRPVYAKNDPKTGNVKKELLDEMKIHRRERVLVVNDLTTTGHSLQTLTGLVEQCGGIVAGYGMFARRDNDIIPPVPCLSQNRPLHSLVNLQMRAWPDRECSFCKRGSKPVLAQDLNSLVHDQPIMEMVRRSRIQESPAA